MNADHFPFPHQSLGTATRIINEVRGINRVVYDITSKPAGISSGVLRTLIVISTNCLPLYPPALITCRPTPPGGRPWSIADDRRSPADPCF